MTEKIKKNWGKILGKLNEVGNVSKKYLRNIFKFKKIKKLEFIKKCERRKNLEKTLKKFLRLKEV